MPRYDFNMTTITDIQQFMHGFSAETTPGSAAKIPDFREHLREGAVVYITCLPGADYNDTVAVAKRLRGEGFIPIPHFAARSIADAAQLEDYLSKCANEAGVDRVLCIAGAVDKPVGTYTDSIGLLNTGLFDKYGIRHIAVAGHPEGSPDMSDEAIRSALQWKNGFAERTDAKMYLVTQFVFAAEPVIAWDKMLQSEGSRLPIHIGIPGLATLKTLLIHARACGIGPSMKFLTRQARNVARLMAVNTPDKLVRDLAGYVADNADSGIAGVHIYPLGGLRRSALWSYGITDGLMTLDDKGGFSVHVPLG